MTEEHPLALHPLAMEMIAEPETDALTLAWQTVLSQGRLS